MKLRTILPAFAFALVAPFLMSAQAPAAKPTAAAAKPAPAAAAAAAPKGAPLDINTASMDQLKALPGIGDVYSKKIVDGRPYAMKTQLTSRGILPQKTYDGIANMIVAKKPAK